MEPNMMPGGNPTNQNQAPGETGPGGNPAEMERASFNPPSGEASGGANMNIQPEEKSVGPIVGSIIVIIVIILGGLYFWGAKLAGEQAKTPEEILGDNSLTQELQSQGTSDEVADIETDLNASDFSDIDADLSNIESQI